MTPLDRQPLLDARRRFARRLRNGWGKVRPIPLPRYVPDTPKVSSGRAFGMYFPPTAATLASAAMSEEAADFVLGVLERLTPVDEFDAQRLFYRWSQAEFRRHWRYADICTALWAAATFVRPSSYLEIGVWRGRSSAVVGSVCPKCAIYGFDLWVPDYFGAPNPGPDFVQGELRAVGHTGEVTLVSGDSRQTLPAFLRQHPDLYFDLITVDGAKSVLAVASDFANALPRLKVGGIVLTDDLPTAPVLRRVWNKFIRHDMRYVSWDFTDAGFGVAAAIRVFD